MKKIFLIAGLALIVVVSGALLLPLGSHATMNDDSYVQRAYEHGVTKYNSVDAFGYERNLSRQEAAKMASVFLEGEGNVSRSVSQESCRFGDKHLFDATLDMYIHLSCEYGLFKGYTNAQKRLFDPYATLTRGQAIAVLMRSLIGLQSETTRPRYEAYVRYAYQAGYIDSDDLSGYDQPITRGELIRWMYAISSNGEVSHEHSDASHNDSGSHTLSDGKLILGDQKYTTTSPKVGYVYSCVGNLNGGGAFRVGEWINESEGYRVPSEKDIVVDGFVSRPQASFSLSEQNGMRIVKGNGLPVDRTTGIYPVQTSDDAYNYDRNPNSISTQSVSFSLPMNPTVVSTPGCLPMGMIGVSLNGVAIFNGLDAGGRDAVAHEIQDSCHGHPERQGQYHYHGFSDCMSQEESVNEPVLVGYALDGFGIYKYPNDPTNDDLDACHGKTGEVEWNGKNQNIYHYVITQEYPYTLGCFAGGTVRN